MSSLTMEYDCDEYMEQAATMLRQQADRIAELEEQNHWLTNNPLKELSDKEIYDILWNHFPISDKEKNGAFIEVMTHCIKVAIKKASEK